MAEKPAGESDIVKSCEFKTNGKIGTLGQKEKLSFMSLVYQIQNGLKRKFPERDNCDAAIKSILPDLALISYLEGKPNLSILSLSKILQYHFKERVLSNSRKAPHETAQEYVMRLMSW